jgi:hypothetical protein
MGETSRTQERGSHDPALDPAVVVIDRLIQTIRRRIDPSLCGGGGIR